MWPIAYCWTLTVVAVALFGDPTHIANVSYDRGTSKKNGVSYISAIRHFNYDSGWRRTTRQTVL